MSLRLSGLKRPRGLVPRRRPLSSSTDDAAAAEIARILQSSSYFEALGLKSRRGASLDPADAKRAYQRLVMVVHPDVCNHPGSVSLRIFDPSPVITCCSARAWCQGATGL